MQQVVKPVDEQGHKAQKSTYQSCSQYSVIQVPVQVPVLRVSSTSTTTSTHVSSTSSSTSTSVPSTSTSTSTQYYNPGTYSGESFVKDNSANRRLEFYLRGRCAATMLLGIGLRAFGVHRRAIFTECVLIMFACALLLLMLAS